GINHAPPAAFLDRLGALFEFTPPRQPGHTVIDAIAAMARGDSKALICMGGNFAVAAPDPATTFAALRKLDLSVHVATKLNRSHLLVGKQTFILPCLGRSEVDQQAGGAQRVSVEDSMCFVRSSAGPRPPASTHLRSECAIVAGLAKASLGQRNTVDWDHLIADYDRIRDAIEAVLPEVFIDYNQRLRQDGSFHLRNPASERQWNTASGKAELACFHGLGEEDDVAGDILSLTSIRSHEQFNTTIYALDDRYRGVFGRRDVLFMAAADMRERKFHAGERVLVSAVTATNAAPRSIELTVVERDLPSGSAAMYYPESNVLIGLDRFDAPSKVPAFKRVPVRVCALATMTPE
ncbi:MAG: CbbBc protein, partial [Xanthomonadales bacterium]|nr:CbbBc protein [Xanthomonadales bacterium]